MTVVSLRHSLILTVVALLLSVACAPAAPANPTSAPAAAAPAAKSAPASAPAPQAAAANTDVKFKDNSVTILVPYSPGGSADIMMRQFAPTFQKHLPGQPTVVVQNMEGAGGIVGENWVYNVAPKDGSVIGQFSTAFADALFTPNEAQFELDKLQWLGSVSETQVTFVRSDLGVKDARGLMESGERILVADNSPQSTRGMPPRLFLALLGVDHKFVTGFGSSGDQRAAIRRGEINMTQDSLSGFTSAVQPMIEEGLVVPIAQTGRIKDGQVIRDPRVPDIPTYVELLTQLKGESVKDTVDYRTIELMTFMGGVQRGWVYAPGVPQNVVSAVREGIGKALEDPELIEGYKKSVGFEPISSNGQETQATADAIVERFKNSPQELERLKQLATEGT